MMGSSAWNGQHSAAEDNFQDYLEMNGMDCLAEGLNFNFQDFATGFQSSGNNGSEILQAQQVQDRQHQHQQQIDTPMTGTEMPGILSSNSELPQSAMHSHLTQMSSVAAAGPRHTSVAGLVIVPNAGMGPPPTPSEAISDIDAKIQFLQHQRLQQQRRQLEEQQVAFFAQQSRLIPPTPQSLEFQAGSRYYVAPDQTPQQGIYDRYQRMSDQQDMPFTPLVSPAVTPLETHFSMDSQFTIPGAYFSPLASPALHAQSENQSAMYDTVSSGKISSPAAELDLATPTAIKVTPSSLANEVAKKAAVRKSNAPKVRGKGSVRQSPITKPLRKKSQTTPNMNTQTLSELAESMQQTQQEAQHHLLPPPAPQGHNGSPVGLTDSENGSVSPETLSEMPPPPVPKQRSPCLTSYTESQGALPKPTLPVLQGKMSPATPASLMRLTSPNNSMGATPTNHASVSQEPIENFELPESVNFQNQNTQNLLTMTKSPAQSPFLGPSEASLTTTKLQPLSNPSFTNTRTTISATQSPLMTAQQQGGGSKSVMGTPVLAASVRKTPQIGPRSGKKRPSIGSSHVSPALRPRISPSIKPLLPGGNSGAEDVASRLLASKSNYQNILEGNSVPGVSYPSELSTNLTSKRTSHKIAEQGRRNRINSALQEIATLLPPSVSARVDDDGDRDGGKKGDKQAGGGPSSKASTVEMAIEYIKMLQREVAEANQRAEEAEKKLKLQSGQPNEDAPAVVTKVTANDDAAGNEVEMRNTLEEKQDNALEAC